MYVLVHTFLGRIHLRLTIVYLYVYVYYLYLYWRCSVTYSQLLSITNLIILGSDIPLMLLERITFSPSKKSTQVEEKGKHKKKFKNGEKKKEKKKKNSKKNSVQ